MAYRARLAAGQYGAVTDEEDTWRSHVHSGLRRQYQRLAVAARDVEEVIRTHAGDGTRAYLLHDTATALEEVGAHEEAIEYARRGGSAETGFQALRAGQYWADLLRTHHPDREAAARRAVFDRFPAAGTAGAWHRAAGDDWTAGDEAAVLDRLRQDPRETVVFLLHTLGDLQRAWDAARRLELPYDRHHDDLWMQLVTDVLPTDPAAVIPVLTGLVETDLQVADARNYQQAAKRLKLLCLAAGAAGCPDDATRFVATIWNRHRNRPRLQQELDRAHLLVRRPGDDRGRLAPSSPTAGAPSPPLA